MAQIQINEISQNYAFNIRSSSFATVALPITASWGPAFTDPDTLGKSISDVLEETTWKRFSATQSGLESFISTYRGPAANYRSAKDYSFHIAQTLLTSGYDILVCRLCPGTYSQKSFVSGSNKLLLTAKYMGTFGNSIMATIKFIPTEFNESKEPVKGYWNLVTYVIDSSNIKTAVENIVFVFDMENSSDSILHISEIESNFLKFNVEGKLTDDGKTKFDVPEGSSVAFVRLEGGKDRSDTASKDDIMKLAKSRYKLPDEESCQYITAISNAASHDGSDLNTLYYNEWLYTYAVHVYGLLKDKLTYSPNRIISPGWDDEDILELGGTVPNGKLDKIAPLHLAIMDAAYYSRCATGMLDVPKSLSRSCVYNDSTEEAKQGYAQMLARYIPSNSNMDVNGSLYQTHSGLFAPWGQYTYVGTTRQNIAPPSFIALLIQKAMMSNQSIQYEWALPTNRKHNVKIGKLAYTIPKSVLDDWQSLEGVGINAITALPDLGTCLWGNSTLYEVPPATYQSLSNLSTRYLVNAISDVVYRAGISITFQYNNDQAYNKFYAAVTPILDTMKNVGAITGYKVKMAADIDGLDSINANSIIGKIYLAINGVVNDIVVDLIALPPNVDLNSLD